MTSEPSPQHGWQPTDRYEPTDEAPNGRGFGLFDAPAAPDEFPVFTPYNGSSRDSDDVAFPPDSDFASSFSGFPSEDISPPSEWASSLSEHYVPAPAVLPIPGVRHDPENMPSWSTSSDSYEFDPYPVPAAELDRDLDRDLDREGESSGASWAAFAAGDSPKAPAHSSGGAWSEPSAPSWEDHPLNESRRDEPAHGEPSWGDSSYSAPASAEPEAAKPVSPAVGSARVSAAAPVQQRPEPQEAPPALPTRPAGRVYGSAAVAPQSDGAEEPAPYAAPAIPMQPAAPAVPPVRASARASVNVAKPNPGEAPPQIARSSTVYGSSTAAPAAPVAPVLTPAPGQAGGPRQGRQHAFGDLLGPAGAAEAPPTMPPTAAPIPAQRNPGNPGNPAGQGMPPHGGPGVPPHGAPGMPPHGGPGMTPHGAPPPPTMTGGPKAPAGRASASMPPSREPSQAAFDQFKPAIETSAPAEPKPERKGRIIIGVLVGCVALLAVAFGGLFLVDKIFNGPSFVVGDCVKQSDTVAVRADCGETGAFQVKTAVTSPEQCQDQSQPHVQQKDQILCLAPVGASEVTATPSATASPNQ